MSDEKQNKESAGPVVVRKIHLRPPPPGAQIEAPQEEVLAPPASAPRPARDERPLWQRVAEQAGGGGAAPSPAGGKPAGPRGGPRGPGPRGAGPGGPGGGPRRGGVGSAHPERGGRGPRGPGVEGPPREAEASPVPRAPPLPPGAPPPAPQLDAPDEGSFADMLAGASATPRRRFAIGEKVAAKIIQLGHDVAFLELGSGVAEGMIDVQELKDAEGNLTLREGDIVDGVVVQANDRGVLVSRGHAKTPRDHARQALEEAAQTGLPVEGVVKAVNKGGLEVEVHGERAFCPISQVDVRFVADPSVFVGQKLQFKVQRTDGRDAVLSRRALLEEERAEKAKATREKLAPGAVFEGTVTSVQEYGAFVDLGGLEGLVHVSELAWDRTSKPGDLLKAGDVVKVQVLRIDEDPRKGERIALSVKALEPRPEPPAAPDAPPRPERPAPPPPPKAGDVVEASVDKIESFGLFVRFAGGRGLVPASETGTPRGADLRKAFKPGDTFKALVLAIDEQHRIRLSKSGAEDAAERAEAAEYIKKSPRPSGKGFGTIGDLLKAKLEKKE